MSQVSFTPELGERFLAMLGDGASITVAAKTVGWTPALAHRFRAANKKFADAWDQRCGRGGEKQERKLTGKQKAFIERYLVHLNASRAAREAGYSEDSARVIAAENLTKPNIRAAIEERLKDLIMGPDEVLARLTRQARGSIRPFVSQSGNDVVVDLNNGEAQEDLDLVQSIKVKTKSGTSKDKSWDDSEVEFRLYSSQAALEILARYHKLLTNKTEVSGPGGGPIPIMSYDELRQLPVSERKRLLREALGVADPAAQ